MPPPLGWVAASLTPPTDTEKKLASGLRDAAQPLVDEATRAAKEVAHGLEQPARDAVEQVKTAAVDSAEHVKDEARDTAERVKENVGSSNSDTSTGGGTSVPGTRPL